MLGPYAVLRLQSVERDRWSERHPGRGPGQVDADDVLGVHHAEQAGHAGAGVGALGGITGVAEAAHQLRPGRGDAEQVAPAGAGHRSGEPVAGQRRDDHVEGVGRVAAVGAGVGQWPDHLEELHRRAGPAVGQDQRQGFRLGRADVQEVDVLAVDGRHELRELVQSGLLDSPVEPVGPVAGQVLQVVQRHAAGPVVVGRVLRPAGAGNPVVQVVEVGLGDVDPEGTDLGGGGHGPTLGTIAEEMLPQ